MADEFAEAVCIAKKFIAEAPDGDDEIATLARQFLVLAEPGIRHRLLERSLAEMLRWALKDDGQAYDAEVPREHMNDDFREAVKRAEKLLGR